MIGATVHLWQSKCEGGLDTPTIGGPIGSRRETFYELPEQVAGREELHHGLLVEELLHSLLGELLQLIDLVLLAELEEGSRVGCANPTKKNGKI